MQLLQTVTLYVDTKDRSVAGRQDVLNTGLSAVTDTWLKRWESLGAREDRFVQRLAGIDDVRATATLAQQTALSLKRDVERMTSAGSLHAPEGPTGPGRLRSTGARSQRVQIPGLRRSVPRIA